MIFLLNPREPLEFFLQEHFIFSKSMYQNKPKMSWDTALCFCLTISRLNIFSFPLQAVYMFYALAIVCDDFFVPSLEKICEVSITRCYLNLCAALAAVLFESLRT